MSEISSDFLEEQFGPTNIEILFQDELTRVTCTETLDGQVLEFSRVVFKPAGIAKFNDAHLRVVRGESMGKVFRDREIEFHRVSRSSFRYLLPAKFGELFGSTEPAIIMDVSILIGPKRTPYARVLETYTPLLKKYHSLESDMPDENLLDKIQILNKVLEQNL